MIIKPIHDMQLIEETMKLPYIWPHIHDDSTDIESFVPVAPKEGAIEYLGVFNPDYCGFFLLVRQNAITFEIHTVINKRARGDLAILAAKSVIDWVFTNTACERLITQIPESNMLAERLAISAGMLIYGLNCHSFKRHGMVQSMKLYGITKG